MKLKSTLLLLLALLLPAVARAEWHYQTNGGVVSIMITDLPVISFNTNHPLYWSNAAPSTRIETNLPAVIRIQVETNVVQWDNHKGSEMFEGYYTPPTDKWIATNIVQKTSMQIQYEGGVFCHGEEKLLSSTTNHFKLTSSWGKAD